MGGNMSGFVLPVELGPTRSCLTSSAGAGHFAVFNQTENEDHRIQTARHVVRVMAFEVQKRLGVQG